MLKGITQQLAGQREGALAAFDHALQLDPTHLVAWTRKDIALAGLGRLEEAHVVYGRVLELDPTDTDTVSYMGDILLTLGRLE